MRTGNTGALALLAVVAVVAALAVPSSASAPVGIYGMVERVVFEPDATAPERIQVWGAFAYADGRSYEPSVVARGYLYFQLPDLSVGIVTPADIDLVRREWADLAAVAGTGQAVAFGRWGYIGSFAALRLDAVNDGIPYLYERVPGGGHATDLRVRPAGEAPASPATYQTNAGIVRLHDQGSHAAIVSALRDALPRAARP